jgi:hypothetical protein
MKKLTKGFVTQVEGDETAETLQKLYSLKKIWEWADKLKDQYRFYHVQEEKNMDLKMADIVRRDSSMFFSLFLALTCQILKSFEEDPRIEIATEIKLAKDRLGFNLGKFGEGICLPGKGLLSEKLLLDTIKEPNIQSINSLHVNIGYFIDKKIQELRNKDFFPFALEKL